MLFRADKQMMLPQKAAGDLQRKNQKKITKYFKKNEDCPNINWYAQSVTLKLYKFLCLPCNF